VNDQPAPATLTTLYRDVIRRHAADPTGFRRAIEATHRHEAYNALCGDRVDIALQVGDGQVQAAAFDGEACAICLASASLLCSLAPGESVEGVRRMAADLANAFAAPAGARLAREQNLPDSGPGGAQGALLQPSEPNLPEALRPLLGVRPYPSRVRCATLPWEAAVTALASGD